MNRMWEGLVTIAGSVVGLAVIATLVSQHANTANVIGASGQAFSGILGTAVSPVTH